MKKRGKILLISIGVIIGAIVVAYFGYYLYTLPSFQEGDFPIWFPAVPLVIVYILVVLRFYYWNLFLLEWLANKRKK